MMGLSSSSPALTAVASLSAPTSPPSSSSEAAQSPRRVGVVDPPVDILMAQQVRFCSVSVILKKGTS
jgi:hypothetical protein